MSFTAGVMLSCWRLDGAMIVTTVASDMIGRRMLQQNQASDEGSGNDHPNSDAPIPAYELVVALSDVSTNESVDASGNERGVMGDEGGFNSVDSYSIMANCALMCLP